jgi:hypothetical protein
MQKLCFCVCISVNTDFNVTQSDTITIHLLPYLTRVLCHLRVVDCTSLRRTLSCSGDCLFTYVEPAASSHLKTFYTHKCIKFIQSNQTTPSTWLSLVNAGR